MPNPPEHTKFKPGQSGNPAGRPPKARNAPKYEYVDETDAPQMLRDMRYVYANDKNAVTVTGGQKAVKMLLDADAARFLSTLERLEADWRAEKEKRAAEERAKNPPEETPVAVDRPLDESSLRLVELIDRWLENHKARAESLHPPSSSDSKAKTR